MPRGPLDAVVQHLHELVSGDSTDGQLLERFVTRRDEAAFEALLRRHGPMVLRVCRRVVDPHSAEDAFQATFLLLARKAGTIGKRDSVGSWLYGTAYRVACKARISAVRRQARETIVAASPETSEDRNCNDLRPLLDEELYRLAERDRAPLVLCYLEGKTYGQAARELGWSEGSMSRRLAQARERLRERLLRRGVALSTAGMAAVLTQQAPGAVPPELLAKVSLGAIVSDSVAALAGGALFPLKMTAAVLLALGTATLGVGLTGSFGTKQATPPEVVSPSTAIAKAPGLLENELIEDPNLGEMSDPQQPAVPTPGLAHLPEDEPLAPAPNLKRRDLLSEDELRRQLEAAPEINVDENRQRTTTQLLLKQAWRSAEKGPTHGLPDLLTQRPDLMGLSLQRGPALALADAETLQSRGGELRQVIGETLDRSDRDILADALRKNFRHSRLLRETMRQAQAVPALMQLLPGEDAAVRRVLVEQLSQIDHPNAGAGLARLALYDLSPEVRASAVEALKKRPRAESRQLLLDGFRYPWPPVADHAAEALVALDDREAVPALERLVDEPDPAAPYHDARKNKVLREVVRVNHLRNCLLCHPPSLNYCDPLRTSVPDPSRPLPLNPYADSNGNGPFVRADVSYLRPDMVVRMTVGEAGLWPDVQRFDFVVRTRPLASGEPFTRGTSVRGYPQREAVRFALKELTGP